MLLSIIIAAYNVEAFIEKCILSCYDQDLYENIEILVVDDGSTDQTQQILDHLRTTIPHLKIIHQKNSGLGASRNIGIRSAKGTYVWMIDGDDFLERDIIRVILENIKENNDIYCVNYNVTNQNGHVLSKAYPNHYLPNVISGTQYYQVNYEKNYTWQYIFRRALFLENDIWFKERINMQDSEILPKILFHTNSVKYIDEVGYNYVQYQNSYTNTQNPEKRFQYFQSIIEVRDSLQDFAISVKNENPDLTEALHKKIESLNQIVLNHLVFYKYKNKDFLRNIELLKKASLFPINAKVTGKMIFIKLTLNHFPILTNSLLNLLK